MERAKPREEWPWACRQHTPHPRELELAARSEHTNTGTHSGSCHVAVSTLIPPSFSRRTAHHADRTVPRRAQMAAQPPIIRWILRFGLGWYRFFALYWFWIVRKLTGKAGTPAEERVVSGAAWDEFCETLKAAGAALNAPGAPQDAFNQAEGYRYLARLARAGLENFLECSDIEAPQLCAIANGFRAARVCIGSDNPDNLYENATLDGTLEYVVRGTRGTVGYLGTAAAHTHTATLAPSPRLSPRLPPPLPPRLLLVNHSPHHPLRSPLTPRAPALPPSPPPPPQALAPSRVSMARLVGCRPSTTSRQTSSPTTA